MILWLLGVWLGLPAKVNQVSLICAAFSAAFVVLGLVPLAFAMEDGVSRGYRREGVEQAYSFFAIGAAFLVFGVAAFATLAAVLLGGIVVVLVRSVGVLRDSRRV